VALTPGTRVGSYEIAEQIGVGGMGEVYRAIDTNLARAVAIKVLPDAVAGDAERLARFDREARTLAALNHPNIATIHGLERSDGATALVMELVEGPTLADRIVDGPIPVNEALAIARQITEALEAAHEQGIVHRDMKPANIKLRPDGAVKVLDFGLAKAMEPAGVPSPGASMSPTITTPAMTQAGLILGSAAYMSPEQARGKPVDRRADIWAFGCVLYEMLTGQRAFGGEDVTITLARVVEREPDFDVVPPSVPARVTRTLRLCLRKDPKARVGDVRDVRLALEGAFETEAASATEPSGPAGPPPVRRLGPWIAAVAVAALATGVAAWVLKPDRPVPVVRFVVTTPPDAPLVMSNGFPDVAISPDGNRIVYLSSSGGAGGRLLYVRQRDELTAAPLRGTENGSVPFFSPDGQQVGFRDSTDDSLKRVSILGGPPLPICDLGGNPRGMSWGPDDTIVFATAASKGLMRVPAVGGEPQTLTTVAPGQDETDHFWPEVLPNGKGVLFTAWGGSAETSRVAVVSLETGEITYLLAGGSHARYASTGHLVYAVGGTLRAVGFDAERLALTSSTPVPLIESVNMKGSGGANFALSENGSLVYVSGEAGGGTAMTLAWVDRDGQQETIPIQPGGYVEPSVSPDGTRVAVVLGGNAWIWSGVRRISTRLTFDDAEDSAPLWTPDGEHVVFRSDRDGGGIYWKAADGTGEVERLVDESLSPYAWTADGRLVVAGDGGIGVVPVEGPERVVEMLPTGRGQRPALSPDGRWLAYESAETGSLQVFVTPFPDVTGGKWQVSTGGGSDPAWSPDGRELFYRGIVPPQTLMSVRVETDPVFAYGAPEPRVDTSDYVFLPRAKRYGVGPDGRFLMIANVDRTAGDREPEIVWVQNWFEELKRLVPTN